MLYGRDEERRAIDRLLNRTRDGRGGALVLRGDPGLGKTALLAYAAGQASGLRLLRVRGIEAESQLPFAGLYSVLRPVLAHLDGLPVPQAAALRAALGLAAAAGQNRFLVAAGVLSLLSDEAERQPVLCLVDDAHWLDSSSLDALLFVARRIEADRIGMIFTTRTDEVDLPGLPELPLRALDTAAAGALLAEHGGAALDERLSRRVLDLAAGNPLALVELSTQLAAAGPAGADPARLPLGARVERAFLQRFREQPTDVRRLLLLAAAEDSGELIVLVTAAARLGIEESALAGAERARLLRVEEDRFDFAHPLIRSAVYQTATFAERQEVHRALAAALDGAAQSSRRTWHRAAAAVPPAEDVADELEKVADEARARSGHGVAAVALRRAAALTANPTRRALLLLDAAEDAWESGGAEVSALVAQAAGLTADPLVQGRVDQLRGRVEAGRGMVLSGYEILVAGADRIADLDPRRAAAMLLEATRAASYGGDMRRLAEAGRRAELLRLASPRPPAVGFVAGIGALLGGDAERAIPLLRSVLAQSEEAENPADPLQLAWAGTAAAYLGELDLALGYAARAVAGARAAGALGTLAYALELLAFCELNRSPAATEADSAEGLQAARETGQPASAGTHLALLAVVAAIRGDEAAARGYADEVAALAVRHELGFARARADQALAWLALGLGRLEEALSRLEALAGSGHPAIVLSAVPDLVEAAARTGHPERGVAALAVFEPWAESAGTPWPSGTLARCRALLAEGAAVGAYFEESLAQLTSSGLSFDSARTQLLYGEFLRRERRRVDARPHLRAAMETFDRLGATPWAERARAELRASGETARRRTLDHADTLTPQELQIARFVACGATNKEVAAQLFVSPRTVDHHLRNVFAKLGITSRAQLRDRDLAG